MKLLLLDTTIRQRFLEYYQQNNDIPPLYFVVKYNEISYFHGIQSNKQIFGTTVKYLFVVPRAFANYPVTKVEIYEINQLGDISVVPSVILDYTDEHIYDGIDQIIEFEMMLTDNGTYVSAIDMFLLTHVTQSLYFSDDLVVKMIGNNRPQQGAFYINITNPTVVKPGTFSFTNGLMVKGYVKDYAVIYKAETGELYII